MRKKRLIRTFGALCCTLAAITIGNDANAVSITIDPGHGGSDPGAVGCGLQEKEINLGVSLKLQSLLKAAGWTVYMTRTGDSFPSLADRSSYANSKNSSTFASIHTNSASATATGIETYAYSASGKGWTQANNIQTQMIKVWPLANRGAKTANYYVLRNTNMPATLSELAFIVNCSKDAAYLSSDSHRMNAARAHCRALVAQWGGTASACEGGNTGGGSTTAKGKVMAGTYLNTLDPATRQWLGGVTYTIGSQTKTTGNENNSFVTIELAPGKFTATASKNGYNTVSRSDCAAVTANATTWCSIALTKKPDEKPAPGTATGAVKNANTGANIANAKVQVKNGASITYNGATNWTFSLDPGTYQILASADGFEDGEISCKVETKQSADCTITLKPQKGTLTGIVTDGNASIPATISVAGQTIPFNGANKWSATVDAGKYNVQATADGYLPGNAECSVAEGKTAECNITLQKEAANDKRGYIRGQLFDASTHERISGTVETSGQIVTYSAIGYYRFFLQEGTYNMKASASGYAENTASCTVVVDQTVDCNINLTPKNGAFAGTIVDAASGLPIDANIQVSIQIGDQSVAANSEGIWNIELPAGEYEITASANGYKTKTVACTVEPGNLQSPCDILLVNNQTAVGNLTGSIYDARDQRMLIPATVTVKGYSTIDYNGKDLWKISDLPEGTYSVSATANGYYGATKSCYVYGGDTSYCDIALYNKDAENNGGDIDDYNYDDPTIEMIVRSDNCSATPASPRHTPLAILALLTALAAANIARRRSNRSHGDAQ